MSENKDLELLEKVTVFCNTFLDNYYRDWAIHIVESLIEHPDKPLKRGNINIWAAGVLCAISQFTPMFDKNEKYHTSIKEVCYYFEAKEPTVYSKARMIMKLLNLKKQPRVISLR